MRIAAVLLAAGAAERFGGPSKLLADLGGEPLITYAARAIADSAVASIIAVTGRDAREIGFALGRQVGSKVQIVHNAEWEKGMGGSVAAGVRALGKGVDAVFIVPGDMPFLTAQLFNAMIDTYAAASAPQPILYPRSSDGVQGNPVLWPKRFLDDLALLSGPSGAKSLLLKYQPQALAFAVADAALTDVDTAQDLAKARLHFSNSR